MKSWIPVFILVLSAATLSGCVAPFTESAYDYTAFRAASPRSILIVPVVNNSVDIDASD